jgi:hypothetical protein
MCQKTKPISPSTRTPTKSTTSRRIIIEEQATDIEILYTPQNMKYCLLKSKVVEIIIRRVVNTPMVVDLHQLPLRVYGVVIENIAVNVIRWMLEN